MPKFYGKIGYAETTDRGDGVWIESIVEREHYGEVVRNSRRLQTSENINDNIVVSNSISIVADPYAEMNFHKIRYVVFMGTKWKVTNVDAQYPRLLLTLGEVYNV